MAKVRIAVLLITGGLLMALLQGLVASCLWGWFLVPLGVPAVSMTHAMGIGLLVGAFRAGSIDWDLREPHHYELFFNLGIIGIVLLGAWGTGAILHTWFM